MKNDIHNLISRIEKLEAAVFLSRKKVSKEKSNFSGITGGVRFLASDGFFDHERTLREIKDELFKHGYRSSIQAVQVALSRLSKAGGELIAYKEGGSKRYAKRK